MLNVLNATMHTATRTEAVFPSFRLRLPTFRLGLSSVKRPRNMPNVDTSDISRLGGLGVSQAGINRAVLGARR